MFTGIILAVGTIEALQPKSGDCRIKIATGKLPMADVGLGDSIAVNGVCLTVIEKGNRFFYADVSNETLSRTTLNSLSSGDTVNLELALTPATRMGGHIVSGHVDGIGKIINKFNDGRSVRFQFQAPDQIAKYIAEKGSICIDGISLTVNEVQGSTFGVNIVPHTLQETTLGQSEIGNLVNLEVDLLARYIERLLECEKTSIHGSNITESFLQQSGFVKS